MILLDPRKLNKKYEDPRSTEVMEKTIDFFENKGKKNLLKDYYGQGWYDDFITYAGKEGLFATISTPKGYGADDSRWDTWRICEFAEILGFYGLQYWYVWQVSVLGLGPIWMSDNEEVKEKTARYLEEGGIFAFGLSEKTHGADIYSTEMALEIVDEGRYVANGRKYYIGNGNKASIVSTFGRLGEDYVFFAADPKHENYELVKNVVASQNYVSEFALNDYPVTEADILHKGQDAWDAALNTVNIGKFNLGWASIGICTHAFYEAIQHSANRILYGMPVTDMPHVRKMFVDGWVRLISMKLFALRASDYLRAASPEDRRYLLFNPMTKMKVTTQGEEVVDLVWDAIAAKGFERDQYFSQAAIDIRALPKLEGTVHVNIALLVKFMPNYFFNPGEFPEVPQQNAAVNDDFLFEQGPTRGLSGIQFHDYNEAFELFDTPNVQLFRRKIEVFKGMLQDCPPTKEQSRDVDYLLAGGQIFALIVYGQLILENAKIHGLGDDLVDEMFDVFCRDFSRYALELHDKPGTNDDQMARCLQMLEKPKANDARYQRVWEEHVHPLKDGYVMSD
ncbi:MAG: acyl-CoA/acyl-ACP dehydrogenase [Candidatus Binatia bacterium]|nr:acyl-CoA/acyl-ACP dehydrogenase [Candidatus Binatia bacterium]MDG2009389.1 acyl-CoA/acyl-ACP dehydrogenase [Candidatus Binatia bacterium]